MAHPPPTLSPSGGGVKPACPWPAVRPSLCKALWGPQFLHCHIGLRWELRELMWVKGT